MCIFNRFQKIGESCYSLAGLKLQVTFSLTILQPPGDPRFPSSSYLQQISTSVGHFDLFSSKCHRKLNPVEGVLPYDPSCPSVGL